LENTSAKPLAIEFDMHPLQYLDLAVTDASGALVSASHYGNVFSPLGERAVLRLAPGEKYAFRVGLLENVPQEKRLPGCYTIRASYRYKELTAISEPLQLVLGATPAP